MCTLISDKDQGNMVGSSGIGSIHRYNNLAFAPFKNLSDGDIKTW